MWNARFFQTFSVCHTLAFPWPLGVADLTYGVSRLHISYFPTRLLGVLQCKTLHCSKITTSMKTRPLTLNQTKVMQNKFSWRKTAARSYSIHLQSHQHGQEKIHGLFSSIHQWIYLPQSSHMNISFYVKFALPYMYPWLARISQLQRAHRQFTFLFILLTGKPIRGLHPGSLT